VECAAAKLFFRSNKGQEILKNFETRDIILNSYF